ncbi:MAG: transcription/translation regulatory transformer protein RfaH [SAR86 cluster bacterium]|uniref:Transcription/translation regulatory transformer protein RfaH n=1 Tax=SAR86 cluster bacterium TaxID=2030880 RepID=A0A2A5AWK9_9GAMM|nr:MAG: transcription/translation regulatory transformer protein RfaH [SAR86 cluster bacterium]
MPELQNIYKKTEAPSPKQEWFVVYAKARQEGIALQNLERQQFHCYLPRIQLSKRRKGQIVPSIEPFFPRYLFVRLALQEQDWAPIRSTRGVCGLVRFEGVPKRIPEKFISFLKENENSQFLQKVIDKSWKEGDQVNIEQGPFAGYSCIFQAKKSADRVSVLLDIVGKPIRATLLKDDLQLPQYA